MVRTENKGNIMPIAQHQARIITALALLFLVGVCTAAGDWAARLLVLAASTLALYEFFSLYWPGGIYRERVSVGLLLGAAVVLGQAGGPLWTIAAIGLVFPAVGLLFLFTFSASDSETRLGHFAPLLHGILYIPCILQLALYMSAAEQWLVILAAIASDTGGYYAGSLYGRRKLWPVISPKKTWEGLWGGLALCVVVCLCMGLGGNALGWALPVVPFWAWLGIGLLLHQAALFGDFFESALKRSLQVKDSGTLLPGHGGVLDRIDSLLFVLPLYALLRLFAA